MTPNQQQPQPSQPAEVVPLDDSDTLIAAALNIMANTDDKDAANDGGHWLADKLQDYKEQREANER